MNDSVKPLKESAGRLRYLEPDEEAKILAEADEPLRTMILVGIYTGVRLLSEGLTLRWADVDLTRGLLTVQAAYAKSGKKRTVPLNAPLRHALTLLRERSAGEYVFAQRDGSPYRSIRTTFQTAGRNAGVKGVSPHVLRHTFASRLVMAGVDLRTIQELGGWGSLEMVQRYSHLNRITRPRPSNGSRLVSLNFPRIPRRDSLHRTGPRGRCRVNC